MTEPMNQLRQIAARKSAPSGGLLCAESDAEMAQKQPMPSPILPGFQLGYEREQSDQEAFLLDACARLAEIVVIKKE